MPSSLTSSSVVNGPFDKSLSTKGAAQSFLTGGISGLFGVGKKTTTDNVGSSGMYNFSEASINAWAAKHPEFIDNWRQYGGNRSFSQWFHDWAAAGTGAGVDQGEKDSTLATMNWLHDFDTYGGDPDAAKAQVAAEQGLSDYVMNNYIYPDLNADQQRSEYAKKLLESYQPSLDAARQTVKDIFPGADGQSAMLKEQLGYNDTVSADQLAALKAQQDTNAAALKTQVGSLQGNIDTEVGARGTAIADQNTAWLANLKGEMDTKTASLSTLIDSLKGNLSAEMATKADSLKAQLATLTSGIGTLTTAQRAALAQQLSENYQSLETEIAAKGQSLQAELQTLGNSTDAQSLARKSALETELNGLYQAQAPLNAIREQGAQTVATAVNLGVQSAQDKTIADMAQQGYVGGSSGTDATLQRAAIGGRQEAAQGLANARLTNATEQAAIGKYGANEGYSLDTAAAAQKKADAVYGANQTRTLADYGTNQHRALDTFGSDATRTISNTDAANRFALNTQGANDTRTLADYGATQLRGIGDAGATATNTLENYGATQLRGIGDTTAAATKNLSDYASGQNRSLGDFSANSTKSLSDYGSSETRNIADTTAQRKLGYFDQDIARRLSSLALPSQAVQAELQLNNMAAEYGQSGLQRAYKNLGFFDTTGASSAGNAQTYTGFSGTDTGFENLGAGLTSLAGSIGNANKWWATPAKTPAETPPADSNEFAGSTSKP